MNLTNNDLLAILPLAVLVVWAMILLLADLFIPAGRKGLTAFLAAVGLVAAIGLTLAQAGWRPTPAFNDMLLADGFSVYLNLLLLVSGLVGVALGVDYLKRMGMERGEYYVLLLFSVAGAMLMAQAADLIVIFLALEILSIPLYVLCGFARPRVESEEASLKYFLLGSFASGFVLYGVAMIFGATGNTGLQAIISAVSAGSHQPILFWLGAGLILVGFSFKVAAVPFHMWTPDVYQGAPSSVTGFMAVGAKVAGFAALLRVFVLVFPGLAASLAPVTGTIAALTMVVGNVLALSQNNIKRLLAYSSIAHAGYILMAFVPYGNGEVASNAVGSALFYLVTYALTSFGAWGVVIALEKSQDKGITSGEGLDVADYAGLAHRHPYLAVAMLIFMLSFTGMPPTLGFWGKAYLFRTAIEGGYVFLAILGLVTSVISAYYYLRIVFMMFMKDGNPVVRRETWLNVTVFGAAALILLFSILPGLLYGWSVGAGLMSIF